MVCLKGYMFRKSASWLGALNRRLRLTLHLALALTFLMCALSVQQSGASTFSQQAEMSTTRYGHTMTLLSNGKVLIAGGYDNSTYLNSAEIYDPATGMTTRTKNMKAARMNHSATLLVNGKVLLIGGRDGKSTVSSAEIFDPNKGTFTALPDVFVGRLGHLATLLPNGKVLIAGGSNDNAYVSTAAIFDPETNKATPLSGMVAQRTGSTATALANGKVLIVGGMKDTAYVNSVELFDPQTGTFATLANQNIERFSHTATLLTDGKVLIAGGRTSSGISNSAIVFDPVTESFSPAAALTSERDDHTATLMPDGTVLIAGGRNTKGYLNTAEVFDPASASFIPTANMTSTRDISSAILLPTGNVLVAGGWNGNSASCSAEIFTPHIPNTMHRLHFNSAGEGRVPVSFSPGRDCSGSCNRFYQEGTVVKLTPQIDSTAYVFGWSGCDSVDSSRACIVTMSRDRHVKLKISEANEDSGPAYTITASAGANGSIAPPGTSLVQKDDNITYTITPAPGYHIAEVVIDSRRELGPVTSYTFTKVKKSHTISAVFAPDCGVTITASADANGTISPKGEVSVPCGSSQTFSITPNPDFRIQDVIVDGTNMGALPTYTFSDTTSDHTISASFTPAIIVPVTYTIIASNNSGGTITPAGSSTVESGSYLVYTITPESGFKIADVLVDNVSVGTVSTYAFSTVTADHTITASFTPVTYTLTATAGINGTVTPPGASSMNHGDDLTYTITPNQGYKVADVLVDNVSVGAVTTYTFSTVTADHTISATFAPIVHTVTATAGANGSITPSGTSNVNHGESLTYTIIPNLGFKVADVLIDNVSVGAVSTYTLSAVTADHTVSAAFAPIVYTVTATAGINGTVTPAGPSNVNHGEGVTYAISPSEGFKVADVLVDNVSAGAVSTYTFSAVIADHTISASFAPVVYTITATAGDNGTIDPSGISSVNHGEDRIFAITPAAGFKVADVLVDGASVGAVTTYTVSGVTANHTISATFTPIVYVITATTGLNGTVTPVGPSNVNHGESLTYTITPAPGYKVADVLVNNVSVGPVTTFTFSNVTSESAISASFSQIVYTLTASANAGGTVTPAGPANVNHGDSLTYTITPSTGFKIADVLVDNISAGAVTTYTFSNVTTAHTISASFAPIVYTVTATAGVNGAITPSGNSSVNHGSSLTYTITPDQGYKVADIIVDNASIGAVQTYTFSSVTADHSITVSFTPLVVNVDYFVVTATPGANGTITPSGAVQVLTGASATFAITPAAGYKVNRVLVNGVNLGNITSYTFTNVTANHTITASFSAITYRITPIYDASKGTMTPSGSIYVNYGGSYTCTAKPNAGYHVEDTLVDGVSVGAVTTYTFSNMTADHTIEFRYVVNPTIIITATAGANGSITPSGDVPVVSGLNQTFTIMPDAGSRVANVVVDGVSKGALTSYTFTKVSAVNHTISATFIADFYTITATAGTNGSITPAGVTTLAAGVTSPVFTITPVEGYKANVVVDGVSMGNISSYTFAGISANHTISATFSLITYQISSICGPNGSMTPANFIYVNHGQGYTWNITPDPGYHIDDLLVDGISVGALATYTFSNVTAGHTIEAKFAANPMITITATAGANGSISPSGTISVLSGSNPKFTMIPADTYRVADVMVDGVSKGSLNSFTITGNEVVNHTIHVTFTPDVYTITPSAGANGSISPAEVVTVAKGGTSPEFIITPALGFKTNLAIDGIAQGPLTSFTFTNVTANHTISASFVPLTFKITPVYDTTKGSMTPSGVIFVNYGTGYSCSIRPAAGYHVADVLIDGQSIGATETYTFTNVISDRTIEAIFAVNPTITITATAGANGSITPSGAVPVVSGTNQTFTMVPDNNYRVADVVVDGVSKGAVNSYTFTNVSATDHTISATFVFDTYIITASAGANGSISPAGVTHINKGADSPTFSITPAVGYKANVVVDGVSQGNISSYTFTNVTANHTITASFSPITFRIIPSYDTSKGSMTPSGSIFVNYGGGYPCSFTPASGYHVDDVLVDGVSIGAVTSYIFSNVTADHTIEVRFAENQTITITATAGINGAITPSGAVAVVSGTNPTFTMMPAVGYRVVDVIVDGVSKGAQNNYTFSKVTAVDHTISVSFTLDVYSIEATTDANGFINPVGTTVVNGGEQLTYTITPKEGYRILNVAVDDVYIGPVSSYIFENISANHTISATFVLNQ